MSAAISLPPARGLSFTGPMIKALIAGTKTQTRRLIAPFDVNSPASGLPRPVHSPFQCFDDRSLWQWTRGEAGVAFAGEVSRCPYGSDGGILWVKEAWAIVPKPLRGAICRVGPDGTGVTYREAWADPKAYRWKSPRFMPRWASRLTLQVESIRPERLHDITEEDARAEGVNAITAKVPTWRDAFQIAWEDINGRRAAWATNPWIWRISFRRLEAA